MQKVVGIRFKRGGKVYWFDPDGKELALGDGAIVETVRGVEFGTVVALEREIEDSEIVAPLKPVIRLASPEDKDREAANRAKENHAYSICAAKIHEHSLPMKLIGVDYTFDSSKIIFYFTADGRIDFRELVKDLASIFRTRIELRQIGVRDEAKMIGGIGCCGRALCCQTFLGEFAPVSIKMAKDQSLSLNPAKISGVCSRLMCCLKYENETYHLVKGDAPAIGSIIDVDGKECKVLAVLVPKGAVRMVHNIDGGEYMEMTIEDVNQYRMVFDARKKPKDKQKVADEEELTVSESGATSLELLFEEEDS